MKIIDHDKKMIVLFIYLSNFLNSVEMGYHKLENVFLENTKRGFLSKRWTEYRFWMNKTNAAENWHAECYLNSLRSKLRFIY